MLQAFTCADGKVRRIIEPHGQDDLRNAVWIDLQEPTPAESEHVRRITGLHVPTEREVDEIEMSSRLAVRNNAIYLSIPVIARRDEMTTGVAAGFVLSPERLLTVRFAPNFVFDHYASTLTQEGVPHESAPHLLIGLLEAYVDREADLLEQIRHDFERISHTIFAPGTMRGTGRKTEDALLRQTLGELGRIGDMNSHIRETLVAISRVPPFLQSTAADWLPKDLEPRLATLRQDVTSISDFGTHLTDKQQFLLDATLGFINIAQNDVMKVMAIASVVGIPPVLVVGVYGMNFKFMPELEWAWGYAYAWAVIILSTLIPMAMFRWRKWI
jgi:magnesium transporter